MADQPSTHASLLIRIRDAQDTQAWARFVDLYAPLVYRLGRRHGLQDADAADFTQEVLRTVAAAIGRFVYDPAKGTFRSWLFTVARNKLSNILVRRRRLPADSGDPAVRRQLDEIPAAEEETAAWDREYQRRLFLVAAEEVRDGFAETTWEAFWRTAVEGQAACDVSASLSMSTGAVYLAKSRVLARIKKQIENLTGD
jgi:RNA polymerase sigma-70 factor (ECF subfamily)